LLKTSYSKNYDVKAFEEIYRLYYPKLCYYVCSIVRSKDASKDIVQDVFSNIWEKRNSLHDILSMKIYLYRAVKNRALDYLKHNKLYTPLLINDEHAEFESSQNVEKECENNELAGMLEKEIDKLPLRCREVFILVKFQGLKYSEVAELLQISTNTIENQMVKAFNFLRKRLSSSL
jgi:RNA polymerase sigma-70 factor, ECF subfamily